MMVLERAVFLESHAKGKKNDVHSTSPPGGAPWFGQGH
jgi:hypothetical protein